MPLYPAAAGIATTCASPGCWCRDRRPRCPSDLTGRHWAVLEPRAREVMAELTTAVGHPMVHDLRAMCDAVSYVVKNGVEWRALPVDFPPWEAVYAFFERWNGRGLPLGWCAGCGRCRGSTRAGPRSRRPAQRDPDLTAALKLARHRDYLADRNANIPIQLAAVWATLGQHIRAEALARSITDPDRQARALTAVAGALARAGQDEQAADVAAGNSPATRQRTLAISADWPWAGAFLTCCQRLRTLPAPT